MTTEKHDPWALLREARDELSVLASYVGHPDTVWPNVGLKTTAQCHKIMRDRIDAALAAHDAVPPGEEAVEWQTDAFGLDYHRQGNMLLMVVQTLDGNWGWETRVEGYAATEAEAKAAAIAAAREMR